MIRRSFLIAGAVAALLSGAGLAVQAADAIPAAVHAAVHDTARPEADRKRDADRKPAEVVAFAGIKAGDRVLEYMPGGGYFTRIFSKVVGDKGVVYALVPGRAPDAPANAPDFAARVRAISAEPQYGNIRVLDMNDSAALAAAEKVDVAWTSLNYHDLHNRPNADVGSFNKLIFDALKPGGVFIVIDHAAASGTGNSATRELHRIEPEFVKKEVTAAGFVFEAESQVLRNPADPNTVPVREGSVAGRTDQFVYRFRKPR